MKPGWKSRSQICVSPSRHGSHDAAAAAERHGHAVADRQAAHRRARPRRPRRTARARGTCGSAIDGSWPIQPCQSLRQTPVARTSTTTPSGAQTGSATASIDERLLEGAHHGGAHRPIVAAVDPLSLPPDELRRLGHHVWDRLVDRWEALDAQPPIAPARPGLVGRRASRRARTARATRSRRSTSSSTTILPARPARRPPALLRPHRQPEQPGQRARRPDRHRPQHVRGQLDRRRGRVGARARRARLAARVDGDAARRPRASSSAAARSARSPRSPPPRTTRVDDRDQATGYVAGAHARRGRQGVAHARLQPREPARAARPIPATGCSRRRSTPRSHLDREAGLQPFVRRRHRRARPAPARRPAQRPRRPRRARGPVVPRRRRLRRARPPDAARRGPAGRHRARRLLVLDPHKWLFQPYEIGARARPPPGPARARVHARRRLPARHRRAASSSSASAARSSPAASRALKLWLSLRVFGLDAFRAAIARGDRARRARRGDARASAAAGRSSRPRRSAIVCFRRARRTTTSRPTRWCVRAVADGYAAPSTTILDGRTVARLCTINPRTTNAGHRAHDRAAREFAAEGSGRAGAPPALPLLQVPLLQPRLVWSGPSGRSAGVALRGVREGCRPLGHAHRKPVTMPLRKVSRPASMRANWQASRRSSRRLRPSWRVGALDVRMSRR